MSLFGIVFPTRREYSQYSTLVQSNNIGWCMDSIVILLPFDLDSCIVKT